MAIVSACLGGAAGAIAAGYGVLDLSWTTVDGANQVVTFQISGKSSKTLTSDEHGHASVTLPVGTYTIHVSHQGSYLGDEDKTVTLESRKETRLAWVGGDIQTRQAVFTSPGSMTASSVSYEVIEPSGSIVASGSQWLSSMSILLMPGSYTLKVYAYGDILTKNFEVDKMKGASVDLSANFCKITIGPSTSGPLLKNITFRGYSTSGTEVYQASQTIYVIRTSTSASIGASASTPTAPSYKGLSTHAIYSWTISSTSVTPNTSSRTVSIPCTRVGYLAILTSGGTLTVPAGKYKIAAIGGGSAAGVQDGGNGGQYEEGEYLTSVDDEVEITIGRGGTSDSHDNAVGGTSSFGTVLSARGGSKSVAGARGGSSTAGYNDYIDYSAQFGGGGRGGPGSPQVDDLTKPGDYGGAGGAPRTAGSAGVSLTKSVMYPYAETPTGGAAGTSGTYENWSYGGGGGGGGRGAKGGDGGNGSHDLVSGTSYMDYAGGGGGGGGINGGSGGKGGGKGLFAGQGGKGYGAGGGGGYSYSANDSMVGGGGGGGGWGTTQLAKAGTQNSQNKISCHGAGAQGVVLIMWTGE